MACTHTPPQPPAPPHPPARVCAPVARTCDASIDDTAALAIVQQRCVPCHASGGAAGHPFTDARALRAAPLADALATCEMPPLGHVLTPEERARLVAWASCGTSAALAR